MVGIDPTWAWAQYFSKKRDEATASLTRKLLNNLHTLVKARRLLKLEMTDNYIEEFPRKCWALRKENSIRSRITF